MGAEGQDCHDHSCQFYEGLLELLLQKLATPLPSQPSLVPEDLMNKKRTPREAREMPTSSLDYWLP
jgi:hypothetical protein